MNFILFSCLVEKLRFDYIFWRPEGPFQLFSSSCSSSFSSSPPPPPSSFFLLILFYSIFWKLSGMCSFLVIGLFWRGFCPASVLSLLVFLLSLQQTTTWNRNVKRSSRRWDGVAPGILRAYPSLVQAFKGREKRERSRYQIPINPPFQSPERSPFSGRAEQPYLPST